MSFRLDPRRTGLALLVALAAAAAPACRSFHPGPLALPGEEIAVPLVRLPVPAREAKLPAVLERAGEHRALVDLAVQVDLPALSDLLDRRGAGRRERRRLTAAALEEAAETHQAALEPLLAELRATGAVTEVRRFAIVNRLLIAGTAEAFTALARRSEVAAIEPETESERPVWAAPPAPAEDARNDSWALAAIGADEAWRRGLDGSGVVVGLLDAGASARHEQLAPGFRGGADAWHDPGYGSREPRDGAFGHGTGVLSCAVGRNLAGVRLGVAPGAEWVACAALPDGRFNNVFATACADWMLRRARPDVVLNAWLLPTEGCDPSFRRLLEAWRVAGMVVVFAAGNRGPGPVIGRSPADYAGLAPDGGEVLSVGGLDRDGELFARSSRGPGGCGGGTFPAVVAPAVDLTTALPLGIDTYRLVEGTSYAAGLVAGAAAILLQAHPEASAAEVEAALRAGTVDLGPPGPDDGFGHGRVDLPRALAALAGLRQGGTER